MMIVVIFTIAIILTGLMRNPNVQTYMARIAAIHLSEYLVSRVKIDKLKVSAFFTLRAEGIEINDLQNKPLIHLKSIFLASDLLKVIKSDLELNRVEIDSARVFFRQYKGRDSLNIVRLIHKLIRNNSGVSDTMSKAKADFKLKVDQLDISSSRFVYQIEKNIGQLEYGIDFNDLDLQAIDVSLKNISIYNDSINMEIRHICANDKSGFRLGHLEGDFIIFDKGMKLNYGLIETPNSNLELNLNFSCTDWNSYANFNDEVKLNAEIFAGKVNTNDLAFFAPDMQDMNNPFEVIGTIEGPIRNLKMRNLNIILGNETKFLGNIQLTGLPNVEETYINLKVNEFSTSINDIQQFQLPDGYVINQLPEIVTTLGKITIKGSFTGFYNDFVSNAVFNTGIGKLYTDVQFKNNPNRDIIQYKGDFKAREFDLGKSSEQPQYFGKLDFDLNVKGEGLDLASLYANVEGKINSFQFKNKVLNDIAINGLFQERQFTGDIYINDELIRADFGGHVNFDTIVPIFDFNLKLDHTYLALLGILPIDESAVLTSAIKLNFSGNTFDNIRGEISFDSTKLFYQNESYSMQNLQITTFSNQNNYRAISLNSDFVDGNLEGEFQLSELKNTVKNFIHYYLPNLISTPNLDIVNSTKNIHWDIRFKNLDPILLLLYRPLQVSKNGFWVGDFDSNNNVLNSGLNFQNASYQGIKIENLQLKINSNNKALSTEIFADELNLKDGQENDTLRLGIDNFRFSSKSINDSIQFFLNWKNKFKAIKNKGDIAGFVSLSQAELINIKLVKADLIINDTNWIVNPDNRFKIGENGIFIEKFGFSSGNQLVEVTGNVNQQNEQALSINFNNFDISNFDLLLNFRGIDLDGKIDGDMQFINVYKNIDFLSNLHVNNLKVNKENIGDVILSSKRNLDKSIFIHAEIEKTFENNQKQKPLVFEGFYYPDKFENSLDFSLYLDQLPVQIVSPFLYGLADKFQGSASGNVVIGGRLGKPDLKGSVRLNDVGFRVIYLNTEYKLIGNAVVDNSFIDLRDAELRDENNNYAAVYGGLFHNYLKDFSMDFSIWPQNFMGLNTSKGMNSIFYGTAFASGSVDISGSFDEVAMEIIIQADRGSDIVIPINLAADVSNNEFITFINRNDKLNKKIEKKKINESTGFSLNMDLSINPDSRVEIILPEDLGNIQGNGNGDINLNLNKDGNFTMAGDYFINKGTFLFTVKNVYKKKFDLVDGGSISWTGDPYTGEINTKAVYHVKTSLNTLGATQDTSFRSRVPVDCVIGLSGQILNPNIKFGFEFPNSPEEVRQLVFSQIDTTNDAEMSRQMLSLLVLNSFSFSNTIGNDNFASSVGGSSLQLVATQLGNWLSQISKEVDVGINYRPGGALTNKEVEVALSTQLFDERVTVDGNFGYQNMQGMPSSNTSNIVGDINVEVKITKDGRLRLKAFNRTNTVDLFDNIAPYTQGVGIFYRKEFNVFKDLFLKKQKEKPATEIEPQKITPKVDEKSEGIENSPLRSRGFSK